MRSTSSTIRSSSLLMALLVLGASPALAKPSLSCGLASPSYQPHGSQPTFRITLDCSGKVPGSRPFPSQSDVLVGLTAYGPLTRDARRTSLPRRWIITDGNTTSFDLPVQRVPLPRPGGSRVVSFRADARDLAGKSHWLFAAWPLSDRRPCDRTEAYGRSGCRSYGYVLGNPASSEAGIAPLASYPGLVMDESVGNRKARWIVEKFR